MVLCSCCFAMSRSFRYPVGRVPPPAPCVICAVWSASAAAADLLERNRARLARAEEQLSRVGNAKAPFTETNVLRPFNEIGIEVSSAASECSLMAEVHPEADVRTAADTVVQELSAFTTRLRPHPPAYRAAG